MTAHPDRLVLARLVLALGLLPAVPLLACSSSHTPGADGGRDDQGPAGDAGPLDPACAPMDARIDLCADTVCDIAATRSFWDGSECVPVYCDCVGPDCDAYPSVEACEAAHAGCDAALCQATGGAWFARAEWCGHFECGQPPPGPCLVATPACDCGAGKVFAVDVGCVDGPLCELVAPVSDEVLCGNSGGTWTQGICSHTRCGRGSLLPCAQPGCACGDLEVFDAERGCIRSPSCEERLLGESCTTTRLCADSVCCATGGASAEMSCVAPMCSDPHGVCGPPRP